jgi:RNA polymerase sigma-70 factor (ECF subfamily)
MDDAQRAAFEATALPHLDALYGAALRLTRNRAEAEDLVQDVYVRAFRFWHTFKQGTSIKAWMFTILRNTFINRYHRNHRVRDVEADLEAQLRSVGTGAGIGETSAHVPSAEAAVGQRMAQERIQAALESIPSDYRMAVLLADLEGLAYKEIADIMGCPIGTVMSRIYRGRKLLHALLRDHAVEVGLIQPDHQDPRAPKPAAAREPADAPSAAAAPPAEAELGGAIDLRTYRARGQA